MATIIATDVCVHLPIGEYERAVIAANRRLAELGYVRREYKHLPDGMRRTWDAVDALEQRGLSNG